MKVCFLCANFPPEIHAGTELVVVALGQALQRRGVEVVAITTSELPHRGEDVRHESFGGIRVLRVFKRENEWDANGLSRPRLQAIVEGLLRAERPDVLHAHSLAGFGARMLQQAAELGIGTACTFHDAWVTCPRYFRLPPQGHVCPTDAGRASCVACVNETLRQPDPQVVRHALQTRDAEVRAEVAAAAVLIAPSRTMAAIVRRHLPCFRPIEVVPHGLLHEVPAARRAPPPHDGEPLRVGTFGSLVEPKGVRELVAAAAGLPCDVHLHGPFLQPAFAAEVRELAARTGVALQCHGPYRPGEDDHPASRLHLAVFPSKCQESYALVVDEALAHGVPVLASDQGALAERRGAPGVRIVSLAELPAALRALTDRDALAALRDDVPAVLPTIDASAARHLELYATAVEALRR